jgi:stringent starvation protein B
MESTKPYLIRAIHEWCMDQGFTPYLSVIVDGMTRVPREFVRNNEIVLNVGLEATHQLSLGNDAITFQARFSGRTFPVVVPVGRVAAIYARENGQGMAFQVEEAILDSAGADQPEHPAERLSEEATSTGDHDSVEPSKTATAPVRGHLTRIK